MVQAISVTHQTEIFPQNVQTKVQRNIPKKSQKMFSSNVCILYNFTNTRIAKNLTSLRNNETQLVLETLKFGIKTVFMIWEVTY